MRRALAPLLLFAVLGCTEEPAPTAPIVTAPVLLGPRLAPVRDLVEEVSRAEVRQGGLLVDLGTPDRHKWIDPWIGDAGWGEDVARGGVASTVVGERVSLALEDWRGGAAQVRLRVRALEGRQRLLVALDGERLGREEVAETWQTLTFALPKRLAPGRHELELSFARGGRAAAALDWVWLSPKDAKEAPDLRRTRVAARPGPRRALLADPPRAYSYYLQVPPQAILRLEHGGDPGVELEVRVRTDDGERSLLKAMASPEWTRAELPLEALAGRMVRIDLVSRGEGAADWGRPEILSPEAEARPAPPVLPEERAKNLVYVLVDTARQDIFRAFSPDTPVKTPTLDALASESVVFEDAYTNAPWTKPSVASLLTSLLPTTHGAQEKHAKVPKGAVLVSEHLKAQGFRTGLVSANSFVSGTYGFDQGWDYDINLARGTGRSLGENVYAHALEFLDSVKDEQRFFLYVQTVDPHVPYHVPGRDLHLYYPEIYTGKLGEAVSGYEHVDFNEGKLELDDDDRAYVRACYYAEVTYHDRHFGEFVKALEQRGLLEDTVLVFSNDHGEEVFDRGRLGHGHSLYEELIRSPLVMRYPRRLDPGRVSEPVSLVDVMPTALELLGVPALPDAEGVSLLGAIHGRPSFAPGVAVAFLLDKKRAVRVGRYKRVEVKGEPKELYDLEADPKETNPLEDAPITQRALDVYLREALGAPKKAQRLRGGSSARRLVADQAKVDDEMLEHLRALGYVGG